MSVYRMIVAPFCVAGVRPARIVIRSPAGSAQRRAVRAAGPSRRATAPRRPASALSRSKCRCDPHAQHVKCLTPQFRGFGGGDGVDQTDDGFVASHCCSLVSRWASFRRSTASASACSHPTSVSCHCAHHASELATKARRSASSASACSYSAAVRGRGCARLFDGAAFPFRRVRRGPVAVSPPVNLFRFDHPAFDPGQGPARCHRQGGPSPMSGCPISRLIPAHSFQHPRRRRQKFALSPISLQAACECRQGQPLDADHVLHQHSWCSPPDFSLCRMGFADSIPAIRSATT